MAKRKGLPSRQRKSPHNCSPEWFVVKGVILLLLGLALWGGHLNLSSTIAILLVLAGIKFILKPVWMK
jgi:hypothetical protein